MARGISGDLQIELSKTITRVGYLLEFSGLSQTLRWCDIGNVTWNGNIFVPYEFTISGIGDSVDGNRTPSLKVQNLDNAAAAIFANADMSAAKLTAWQVAPAAVDPEDPVPLGVFMFGDMEIGLDTLSLRLVNELMLDAYAPRRRVDPANGFNYAMPEGTQIAWENEIYIVEHNRG